MYTLYKKELASFFSSLIGYLTIAVFLILTGLQLWVFNGSYNIIDHEYAGMEGLFDVGQYLYLFLIPAITMRTFAEERRGGTIEMLMTHPLSDWTIVFAKFLASWTLVFISLLPTLVCYFSVYALGESVGNIDTGSVIGSYFGLLLLGAAFVAIGIFASALTGNQIVSFILALAFSAAAHLGFEAVAGMNLLESGGDIFIRGLGLKEHYESISRGVIDTRDLLYFVSIAALFLMATRMVLQSRMWNGWKNRKNLKRTHWLELGATLLIVISVNIFDHFVYTRLDLTEEKRYTLTDSTEEMLEKIDEPMLFRVYLEGEMSPAYKHLQYETREMLNKLRASNSNITYEFVDPNTYTNPDEGGNVFDDMEKRGIYPIPDIIRKASSETRLRLLPAIDITYQGNTTSFALLPEDIYTMIMLGALGNSQVIAEASIANLENTFISAIGELTRNKKPRIGFLLGHGELFGPTLYDIQRSLSKMYDLDTVNINGQVQALTMHEPTGKDSSYRYFNKFDLLIVAKPTQHFSDEDLFLIDQYIMYGGRVLWLVDPLNADMDSLSERGVTIATRYPLGLDEMFFTYGVRLNANLLMDIRCRPIPLPGSRVGESAQYRFYPWYYFPDLTPAKGSHPIVAKIDAVRSDFISSIDLIDNDIKKTVLLTTSEYSRIKNAPASVEITDALAEPDQRLYNKSRLPVAVLLEGEFKTSWPRHRLAPELTSQEAFGYREQSVPNKMIVIADGDIIRNRFRVDTTRGVVFPYPLGLDYYSMTLYENKEFLLNAINYLLDDEGLIESRSKEVKVRKLDMQKAEESRSFYQIINIVIPLLLLAIAGVAIVILRRKKFAMKL